MNFKKRISGFIIALTMIIGLFGAISNIKAASDPADAPSDWAFEASSVGLNDAIIAKYPAIDIDGDGFISISEANLYTGAIWLNEVSGTLNGIENFTQVIQIGIGGGAGGQLSGNIPEALGNLTKLNWLSLNFNRLTGNIPTTLGNLTKLTGLGLEGNLLTGTIPEELGNLTKLTNFQLSKNKLTGGIPTFFNYLLDMESFQCSNNDLEGEIPESVYSLPKLKQLNIANNVKLTGNPALGFATSTTLNYLDIRGTSLIQASPEIPTLGYTVGTFLYDSLASDLLTSDKTNLNDTITQNDIDNAQESADFITDSTIKQQWQDDIDLAQKMLDAKNKVNELLTTPDLANLKPGVDANIIDEAQEAVNKLPAGDLKTDLQAKIDIANNLLVAKDKVAGLVKPDGSLGTGVNQAKIDEAQEAVNKLPNGDTKTELQKIIDEAIRLLNEQNTKVNYSKVPSNKDVVSSGSIAVNTSDTQNQLFLVMLLGTSMFVGYFAIRKKQNQK